MKKLLFLVLIGLGLSTIRTTSAQTPTPTINGTPPPFTFTGGVTQTGQNFNFATSVANALTLNNSNSGATPGSTFNGSAAVTLSANTLGAGSLANANTWSAANTFSVGLTSGAAVTAAAGSTSVALNTNSSITVTPSAVAAEQGNYGARNGVGIPVGWWMPVTLATPAVWDLVPTFGAANFSGSTGVGWIDVCDSAFTKNCNDITESVYRTIRVGIMNGGLAHIESAVGGGASVQPLCLQCGAAGGNGGAVVIGGSLASASTSAALQVLGATTPFISVGTGDTNVAYWAVTTTSNFLLNGTVAGDMALVNHNGNIYIGATASNPGNPNMEIVTTTLGVNFFGPAIATNSNPTIYTTTTVPNGTSAGVYFMGENTSATTGTSACDYLSAVNSGGYNTFFYLCDVSTSTNYLGNLTILSRSGASTYAEQAELTESTAIDGGTWITGNYTATVAAATVSSGQISYGGTTAAVSNCGSLATACVVINVAGTAHYIPYY